MIAASSFPLSDADHAYRAAVEADGTIGCRQYGFDDRHGRRRLTDLIHPDYVFEMKVIAQSVRWYQIGLLTPAESRVPHPAPLMEDLRYRIRISPHEYIRSPVIDETIRWMSSWWRANTITSAWKHLEAHVETRGEVSDLADALADLLWDCRHHLINKGDTR